MQTSEAEGTEALAAVVWVNFGPVTGVGVAGIDQSLESGPHSDEGLESGPHSDVKAALMIAYLRLEAKLDE